MSLTVRREPEHSQAQSPLQIELCVAKKNTSYHRYHLVVTDKINRKVTKLMPLGKDKFRWEKVTDRDFKILDR